MVGSVGRVDASTGVLRFKVSLYVFSEKTRFHLCRNIRFTGR